MEKLYISGKRSVYMGFIKEFKEFATKGNPSEEVQLLTEIRDLLEKNRLEIFSAQVAKLTGVFINERSE